MKVLIYTGSLELVEKSGVGQAIHHQMQALESAGIPYTTNPKDDYDIVHINTIFPDSFFTAIKNKYRGKKVVYYGHSTKEDFRNSFLGSNLVAPLFKWWIKRCYNRGDVVLTPTPYSKQILDGYRLKSPVIDISNGIDLRKYARNVDGGAEFRKKYGYTPEDKVIISVGHYMDRKGIVDFVNLAHALPEYKFIWFGFTPAAARTPDINKALKNIPANLTLPGLATQEELINAYSGSDLFLFLTHEETEGIVLLEALATRTQVLVRDIEIYKTWFEDGRNLYKASSFEEFKEKISKIFEGKLSSTTDGGYEKVSERSIEKVGEKLKEIYSDLLK